MEAGGPCVVKESYAFLNSWMYHMQPLYTASAEANWANNIDISDENAANAGRVDSELARWATQTGSCGKNHFVDEKGGYIILPDPAQDSLWKDENLQKRALDMILNVGPAALESAEYKTYNSILQQMQAHYSTSTVAVENDYSGNNIDLGEIEEIMYVDAGKGTDDNYEQMRHLWEGWHNTADAQKANYTQFVELSNKGVVNSDMGHADTGAYWRSWYEDPEFEKNMESLWGEVSEIYQKLFFYVRGRMSAHYGEERVNPKDAMPAHIFGNMWAQDWSALYPFVVPHPEAGERPDATEELSKKSEKEMFEMADAFFQGLGLPPMTATFWEKSQITKKDNMVCHASAWDFFVGDAMSATEADGDYRIKQCTVKTHSDFVTVHHEMGHIQYYQNHAAQPVVFRNGANPGFHEAIGDTIALSVNTPAYLEKVGLLSGVTESPEADLNYLMQTALTKIGFLPFGYVTDLWRWKVFSGETKEDQYQSSWTALRNEYQGIVPPVVRDDAVNFDAAAKFHIPNNTPYIRYFISHVLQFQFYEKMCEAAGHKEELYKCSFADSTAAGDLLKKILEPGNSKDAATILKEVGIDKMSADSLKKYFEPLIAYLETANSEYDQTFPSESKWLPCAAGECPPKNDASGSTTVPSNTTATTTSSALGVVLSSALLAIFALLW
jgi:peptidyl-dipeptidase A